jgi:hypothetical protein
MLLKNKNSANPPGAMFFAAYFGLSMNPTLREPEMLEVAPYNNEPVRVGDVVFFLRLPESDQPVVHRVARMTRAGIFTRGDNNTHEDNFLLQPGDIKGRVLAAPGGQKRRKIAGGSRGRLTRRWLLCRRSLGQSVAYPLRPVYSALSRWGFIAGLLPAPLRPRVAVFQAQGEDQFRLMLGKRVIGRYDDQKRQWRIQRPFRLIVDQRTLGKATGQGPNRFRMTRILGQERQYTFALADESRWVIAVVDKKATSIVSQLGDAMRLRVMSPSAPLPHHGAGHRRLVLVGASDTEFSQPTIYTLLPTKGEDLLISVLLPFDHGDGLYIQLVRLSLAVARAVQAGGGVLIHGALAERDGMGVILAAPGGTGKTTASNRLPAPWRPLCDDTTLVVRDPQGNYWAHPWPTWSRFVYGGSGGAWDVQLAVPLRSIFFLSRAHEDRVELVGAGQAVSLLVECANQASALMVEGLGQEETRSLHLERFNNLCALSRVVPAHLLHLSLTGAFWDEIEQALEDNCIR